MQQEFSEKLHRKREVSSQHSLSFQENFVHSLYTTIDLMLLCILFYGSGQYFEWQ